MIAADRDLGLVLPKARTILLDFDGPVCSVFAGYRAPVIARVLRGHLSSHDVPLSSRLRLKDDPLALLRFAGNLNRETLLVTRTGRDSVRLSGRPASAGRSASG